MPGERVLLVNPKDSFVLGSPPLGVGFLAAYATSHGSNDVRFHDENFISVPQLESALDAAIEEYDPTLVGITFPSSAVLRVAEIVRWLAEKHPARLVFAGGYHPTSEPEATLRALPGLDFIVLGQAEHVFSQVGPQWRSLSSVAYLDEHGVYHQNPIESPVLSLDDIPHIDRNIYDSRYFEPGYAIAGFFGKTATLMTSRGCPYNCNFCSNRLLQKHVKYHSIDYSIAEVESVFSQLGAVDALFFLDVNFIARPARTSELCEELIRSRVLRGVKWAATVSANGMTIELARLLKAAGCFYLSFGFESNSAHSLQLMNKTATPADNERAASVCEEVGILCNSAFLFGIPGEREVDLAATLDFVQRHNIFSTGVNIMKPLPGSPYYYDFVAKDQIHPTVEDWHQISAIDRFSGFFNDQIPAETYQCYIAEFNRIVGRRARRDNLRVNGARLARYRVRSLLERRERSRG